ncbi:MAG: hypothetical protein KF734_16920 [Saprospiraceae bacterium]|nr:hypothetical protein [Saprospiraceae bacterium]
MTKFFPSLRKSLACMVVFALAAFFFAESANAQGIPKPAGENWKPESVAVSALNQQIAAMDQQLLGPPNEPLLYKRKFYGIIVFNLEQGQAVLNAVNNSYLKFVSQGSYGTSASSQVEIPNPLSVAVWQDYHQEVTTLLQND